MAPLVWFDGEEREAISLGECAPGIETFFVAEGAGVTVRRIDRRAAAPAEGTAQAEEPAPVAADTAPVADGAPSETE